MRIRDLLLEDQTVDEITNDLMDIILTYKQKGFKEIPMNGSEGLIPYLKRIGHDTTVEDLMDLLAKNPFDTIVKRSGIETVDLKSSIPDTVASTSQLEKSKKKVAKTASKVAKKALEKHRKKK